MTAASATGVHPPMGHDDSSVVGRRQRLGVILVILADVAFVLSLVFTWFYLRSLNTEGAWIPQDKPRTVGIGFGWVIAAGMVVSWLAYAWGERGIRVGDRGRLVLGVLAATAFVVVDAGLQIYQFATLPIQTDNGSYASSFIMMSGYHMVHLGLTLFLGLAIWNRARLGLFTAANHWHVRLVGLWWLWVTLAALITALTTSFTTSPHVVG